MGITEFNKHDTMNKQDGDAPVMNSIVMGGMRMILPYIVSAVIGAGGAALTMFRTMEMSVVEQRIVIVELRDRIKTLEAWKESHKEFDIGDSQDIRKIILSMDFRIDKVESEIRSGRKR